MIGPRFSVTTVQAELANLGVEFDTPEDLGNGTIRVVFSKCKKDHHATDMYRAVQYYLSGTSPISALYSRGRYEIWLVAKS